MLPDPAAQLSDAWLGPVPELFARRAARQPEAVAIADPEGAWTYGELDAPATALAADLLAAASAATSASPSTPIAARRWSGGGARGAEGGRRLLPARPRLPAGPAGGLPRAGAPQAAVVRLAAAGEPAAEVEAALARIGCDIRLTLAPGSTVAGDGAARSPSGPPSIWAPHRHRARRRRRCSASPRARPASPRGSSAATARSPTSCPGGSAGASAPATGCTVLSGLAHDPAAARPLHALEPGRHDGDPGRRACSPSPAAWPPGPRSGGRRSAT